MKLSKGRRIGTSRLQFSKNFRLPRPIRDPTLDFRLRPALTGVRQDLAGEECEGRATAGGVDQGGTRDRTASPSSNVTRNERPFRSHPTSPPRRAAGTIAQAQSKREDERSAHRIGIHESADHSGGTPGQHGDLQAARGLWRLLLGVLFVCGDLAPPRPNI